MQFDARGLEPEELFRKLKQLLLSCSAGPVEVLVSDRSVAGRVQAFARMSGCPAEIASRPQLFAVRISENTCGCAR